MHQSKVYLVYLCAIVVVLLLLLDFYSAIDVCSRAYVTSKQWQELSRKLQFTSPECAVKRDCERVKSRESERRDNRLHAYPESGCGSHVECDANALAPIIF